MNFKKLAFAIFLLFITYQSSAQRNFGGYNFLGITGGATFFDINTDDLVTKSRSGFTGGFTSRGSYFNDFDLIYGINFQNSKIAVEGMGPLGSKTEDIEYTIQGVQINFLGSYNLILDHLSLEVGPVVNINGKMKLKDKKYEDYTLTGYTTTTAKDIQDISKFDMRVMGGLTAGLKHFRLTAQYQYGVTNMLAKLNDKGLGKTNFKGNSSTIIVAAIIYF